MTIREVLEADWTVAMIDITVRECKSMKYIMRYCIGKDVEPGRSQKFAYEAECGDVYEDSGMKTLFINRVIQFRQLDNKPLGKEMRVGVLCKKIPKELLDLVIEHMNPYHYGFSDGMHGYYFDCYVDTWSGIPGENKQIELEGLN